MVNTNQDYQPTLKQLSVASIFTYTNTILALADVICKKRQKNDKKTTEKTIKNDCVLRIVF